MIAIRKRWRLRSLMVLIAVVGLGAAWLRKLPTPGPAYRLQYGDAGERASAAVQLGMLGPKLAKGAEPALEAALSDPNQSICDCAAWALDQFGSTSPALVKALVKQVEVETAQSLRWRWQGDFYRHVEPAGALARIKPPASILAPLLVKAMSSPDPWIRFQAATLLHKAIGWSSAPTSAVSPLLLTALHDQEASIRLIFIDDLPKFDEKTRRAAADVLAQRLQSQTPADSLEATLMLARLGSDAEPAVGILAGRLLKEDLGDRLRALFLLGKLGPEAKPAVTAVLQAMKASDAGKSQTGFLHTFWRRTTSRLPCNEIIALNPEDRKQPFDSICECAMRTLARIDHEAERQGLDALIQMLNADTTQARRAALDTLASLGPKASSALPALIESAEGMKDGLEHFDPSKLALQTFVTISKVGQGDDPRLVGILVRMLESGSAAQRVGAVLALEALRPVPNGVLPALMAATKDPVQSVRSQAATALGHHHGPEREQTLPALLAMMNDTDSWVRLFAGRSLADHGEAAAEAVPTFIRLIRAKDRNQRRMAAEILGQFGPTARAASGALLAASDDETGFVRNSAEIALNAVVPIETETAAGALDLLQRGNAAQRIAAVCDLFRPGSAARVEISSKTLTEALQSALGDGDSDVRATAAASLGLLGRQAEETTSALLVALRDESPEVRALSAIALGRVASGDAKSVDALGLARQRDPDLDVRNAAASSLARMGR